MCIVLLYSGSSSGSIYLEGGVGVGKGDRGHWGTADATQRLCLRQQTCLCTAGICRRTPLSAGILLWLLRYRKVFVTASSQELPGHMTGCGQQQHLGTHHLTAVIVVEDRNIYD